MMWMQIRLYDLTRGDFLEGQPINPIGAQARISNIASISRAIETVEWLITYHDIYTKEPEISLYDVEYMIEMDDRSEVVDFVREVRKGSYGSSFNFYTKLTLPTRLRRFNREGGSGKRRWFLKRVLCSNHESLTYWIQFMRETIRIQGDPMRKVVSHYENELQKERKISAFHLREARQRQKEWEEQQVYIEKILQENNHLKAQLDLKWQPSFEEPLNLSLESTYKEELDKIIPFQIEKVPDTNDLWVALGYSTEGFQWSNVSKAIPHGRVLGDSNSGKSGWFKAMALTALVNYAPKQLVLAYADNKKVTANLFKKFKHSHWVGTQPSQNVQIFKEIRQVMKEREDLFAVNRVENISEYKKKTGKPLPFILLIVEELSDYAYLSPIEKTECKNALSGLVTAGRSSGIHVFLGSQIFHHELLPKRVTEMCRLRIGLRSSEEESLKLIKNRCLADIPVENIGRAFVMTDKLMEVQTPLVTADDIDHYGKPYIGNAPDTHEISDFKEQEKHVELTKTLAQKLDGAFDWNSPIRISLKSSEIAQILSESNLIQLSKELTKRGIERSRKASGSWYEMPPRKENDFLSEMFN